MSDNQIFWRLVATGGLCIVIAAWLMFGTAGVLAVAGVAVLCLAVWFRALLP